MGQFLTARLGGGLLVVLVMWVLICCLGWFLLGEVLVGELHEAV